MIENILKYLSLKFLDDDGVEHHNYHHNYHQNHDNCDKVDDNDNNYVDDDSDSDDDDNDDNNNNCNNGDDVNTVDWQGRNVTKSVCLVVSTKY